MPSISHLTRSPGSRNTGGSRKTPTPAGVPVAIRSPGSSVIWREMKAMSSPTPKIIWSVVAVLHQLRLAGIRPAGTWDPPAAESDAGGRVEVIGRRKATADRQERVAALRPQPLAVALLSGAERRRASLPVARRDVVHDDVAGDMRHRLVDRHPAGPPADHDAKLDLEVERVCSFGADDRLAVADDRARQLCEQQRLVRGCSPGALGHVVAVVQADADDRPRTARAEAVDDRVQRHDRRSPISWDAGEAAADGADDGAGEPADGATSDDSGAASDPEAPALGGGLGLQYAFSGGATITPFASSRSDSVA